MNLKESFRYQNFLDGLMSQAEASLVNPAHAQQVIRRHNRQKFNPDAKDETEVVDAGEFYKNDDVLRFMVRLVEERGLLSNAIGRAKASLPFDLDAAIDTNKYRQAIAVRVKHMLRFAPSKRVERGIDYKFNAEGNQIQYYYDMEIESKDNFDRDAAKSTMRTLLEESDKVSSEIDAAMINTAVEYDPPFHVNDSFEDAMEIFLGQ